MPGVYKASRRRSLCSLSHSAPAGPQVFSVTLSPGWATGVPCHTQLQRACPASATGVPCHTQPHLSHRCSLSHSAPPQPQVFPVTLSPGWATGVPCHTQPQRVCPASATGVPCHTQLQRACPASATGVLCHTQPRLGHRCSLSHSAPVRLPRLGHREPPHRLPVCQLFLRERPSVHPPPPSLPTWASADPPPRLPAVPLAPMVCSPDSQRSPGETQTGPSPPGLPPC
ncbi:uncharacterized protein [Symphalangus syndactylus]|uniref:uncharacterized protein isoform X2 n=1 Tax=Symphalangus syndactylus TaxID=9590 RepID=UPI00300796C6